MSAAAISCIAFACVLGGAMLGMFLRVSLPEHHLSTDSKDFLKLGTGLIATMAALVLGLLIASAKNSYDIQRNELTQVSASIIVLDRLMSNYGPETKEVRDLLRRSVVGALNQMWPEHRSQAAARLEPGVSSDALHDEIYRLTPHNEDQRLLKSQALTIILNLRQTRWLELEQRRGSSIPMAVLAMLVFWLAIIFVSFGLFAPPNSTVLAVLFVCVLSVSGAIFLILELDRPFEGLIRIPSRMQKNGVKGTDLLVPRCGEGRGTAPLGAAPRCTEEVPALLRSSGGRSQVPDADQVVDGQAEDEHPAHAAGPAVSGLAQEPDGFEPAQDFLDALAFPLTHSVAVVARGAPIDRTRTMRRVLGYVRRHLKQPEGLDEVPRVIAFVGAHCDPACCRPVAQHLQRPRALAVAAGPRHAALDGQAVPVVHEHVPLVDELGLVALGLAEQSRVGIGGRAMGDVTPPLAVEVYGRVPRIVRWEPTRRVLLLEALEARPGLDQGAVDREVLVGQEAALPRLRQDPLAVLREHCGIPDRVVHVQPDEPAKEQVVIQLLHQQPFAPRAVEDLQQERPQQLLGRDRGPADRRVERRELEGQLRQHRIHHRPDRAQRMVRRHALLRRQVAPHPGLLAIVASHARLLAMSYAHRSRTFHRLDHQKSGFSASC